MRDTSSLHRMTLMLYWKLKYFFHNIYQLISMMLLVMELIIPVSSDFDGSEEIACVVFVGYEVVYVTHWWMYEPTDVSADFVFAGVLTKHKDCVCFIVCN
jgi:hypothetical protein